MEEVRSEGGMVIKKVRQGLGSGDSTEQDRKEDPERAGRAHLESFGTALTLLELRSDESVPFHCSNPWTDV